MKRLRVLSVIANLYIGGDEHRLLHLAKYIDRSRFDHRVVCIKRETQETSAEFGSLRPRFIESNATIIDLNQEPATRKKSRNRAAFVARGANLFRDAVARVADLARSLDADVIDGHVGTGNRVAVAAALLTRTPSVVTTYNAEAFRPYPVYYASQQLMLHYASGIMTDADETRDDIQRWMWRRSPRFYVIANGTAPPQPVRSKSEMAAELQIPPGRPVVGTIATFFAFKGHAVLLRAAKLLAGSHPDILILLVGFTRNPESVRYRQSLEALAAELGIRDRVRFSSYEGHIGDIWQMIDVHVHPSLKDSLPNAIIEGMSLQKPQVVTDVGGIAQMVTDNQTGLVVPPNDPPALATSIAQLLDDREFARSLTNRSYARYEERYRPEAMARSIETVFTDLASRKR